MEHYRYGDVTATVKEILVSVQKLRCRKRVQQGSISQHQHKWLMDEARQIVKLEILEHLGKFIEVFNTDNPYEVEAEFHMPYVQNDVIENLESEIKRLNRDYSYLKGRNIKLVNKIKKLESRSLWQRILNKWVNPND